MKFAFLAFSEVNPDNVSVYAQNTQAERPGAALCVYQKRSFSGQEINASSSLSGRVEIFYEVPFYSVLGNWRAEGSLGSSPVFSSFE
jgi:hypothetical protein